MSYTMDDFRRDYIKEHFPQLIPEEQREALARLPLEQRLAGLSVEQIEDYLKRLTANQSAKRSRKKNSKK